MPFASNKNKNLKCKGVQNTTTLKRKTRVIYSTPPYLRQALSSMILKIKQSKGGREEKGKLT